MKEGAPLAQRISLKRINGRRHLNLALCLVSVLGTIVGVEIALRPTAYGEKLLHQRSFMFPPFYHTADVMNGFDITPNFPPTEFIVPDYIEAYGKPFTVSSNEVGCRDRRMDRAKRYVLLLGDSFTWANVPLEATFGTIVENLIGVRVLKCGVSGYGPRQELHKLEKVVKQVGAPSVIIIGYFIGNDLVNDYLYPENTELNGYVVQKIGFADQSNPGERRVRTDEELREEMAKRLPREETSLAAKSKYFLVQHSLVYNALRNETHLRQLASRLGLADPPSRSLIVQKRPAEVFHPVEGSPWLRDAWKVHLNNLKHLKRAADEQNAKLLIVLIPTVEQVYEYLRPAGGKETLNWEYPNVRLRQFFEKERISFLDLLPEFRRYANLQPKPALNPREDLYWPHDPHLNVKGNQLAALLISRYMLDQPFLQLRDKDKRLSDVKQLLGMSVQVADLK
jgi:hypothetical protein